MIFLRVSFIEAYNSTYNNDIIGTVETHLESKRLKEDMLTIFVAIVLEDEIVLCTNDSF